MIAHRIPKKSGRDSFGRLGCYVLDLKSPDDPKAFDRLAGYVVDREGDGERVVGARVTNCGSEDLEMAIAQIEATQAMNKRSKADKSYHLVISFPEGERPTLEQLHDIEDRLCEAIGLADHQRISAIHDDTDNLHVHVAINKVHPETFNNVEPYYDHPKLMAACVELEIKHGLIRVNHGVEAERDAGANVRDGAVKMEEHSGRESLASWIEKNAKGALVVAGATAPDWAALHAAFAEHGLTLKARGAGFVIGADQSKAHVKASSVDASLAFKVLVGRLGAFEPAPSQERQERGQEGQERAPGGKGYEAGPKQRGGATQALYARFKEQRGVTESARTQAFANVALDHATDQRKISRDYRQMRADTRANRALPPHIKRKSLRDMELDLIRQKAERKAQAVAERAEIRRAYPLPTWQGFLEREASRGDEAAVSVLRSHMIRREPGAGDILTAKDREAARHVVYQQLTPTAAKNGDLVYVLKDGGQITDRAGEVRSDKASAQAAFLALSLAADRFVGQPLIIQGSDAFKAAVIEVSALRGFDVTFADPEMEAGRKAAVARSQPEATKARGDGLDAYIASRNAMRDKVTDIPLHRRWTPADAGTLEYAGRRAFPDGGEAVLLRRGAEIVGLPVTSNQAAKASKWSIGEPVAVDTRGRFIDLSRAASAEDRKREADDLAKTMNTHARAKSGGPSRGGGPTR